MNVDQKGAAGDNVARPLPSAAESLPGSLPGTDGTDGTHCSHGRRTGQNPTRSGNRRGANLAAENWRGCRFVALQHPDRLGGVLRLGIFLGQNLALYLKLVHPLDSNDGTGRRPVRVTKSSELAALRR
jgi:hypothetical protein